MSHLEGRDRQADLSDIGRRRVGLQWPVVVAVLLAGIGAVGLGIGLSEGSPSVPRSSSSPLLRSTVPAGASLVATRSINHWTLRVFASPSGLTPASVTATYEEFNAAGKMTGSGSGTLGASLLAPEGVVDEGGGGGDRDVVEDCQVTNPAIAVVRLVSGDRVVDSMVPVTFDSVRFVVLAALNSSPMTDLVIQGLDGHGAVVTSSPLVVK